MLKLSNRFCFVCGKFTNKEQQTNITYDIKKMYMIYFGCPLGDQDKTWASHKICRKWCLGLHNGINKRSSSMPFAVPMIWGNRKITVRIAIFISPKQRAFPLNRDKIAYPNLDSGKKTSTSS